MVAPTRALVTELHRRAQGSSRNGLPDHIGQEPEKARPLDGARELALLLGRHGGDAARHDLAALGDVALQQPHVLVVDLGRTLAGERAALAAPEERPPCRLCLHGHQLLPSLPLPLAASRGGRGGRGPRSPKSRGARSPKRPPPPSPSRSSRPRERIIADGPSSSSTTRTVRKRSTSSLIDCWRSTSSSVAEGASMFISV